MTVGDWFNAQQAFNHDNFACSAGQTISEYCSKAQDSCCAVCPNAPITGPGTLIVMTLGTFVNLLFVLWYQSEAPYNLAYQIVATDAAAFGLLNRLIQSEYRLSRFHYAMVPLAMMSCLPLALASCLNDLPSYHSQPPSATAEHQLKLHDKREGVKRYQQEVREAEALKRRPGPTPHLPPSHVPTHPRSHDPNASIIGGHYEPTRPPHPRRTEHSLRRPGTSHTLRTMTHAEEEARAERDGEGAQFKATGLRPMASARPIAMLENMGEIELPRRYLIITAWIFFTIHLFLWPFLFSYVYFFNTSFNQPNCTEEFPGIERLELVLCCLVSSWLFFAFLMWGTFTWTLYYPGKVKFDMLEWIGKALHIPREDRTKDSNFMIVVKAGFNSSSLVRYGVFTREITYVAPPQQARDQEREKEEDSNSSNRKKKERHPFWYSRARPRSLMRWLISLASFWFFCIEYMVIWFVAVDDFILIGTNGFDFGQVVAVVSIIVPAFLIGRAQLDYEFYWDSKHKFWDKHFGQAGQTHEEEGGGGIGHGGGEKGLTTPDLPDGYKGFASGTKPIPRLPVIPRVASVVRGEEGSSDEKSDRSSRRRGRRSSTVRRGDDYGDESDAGELEPIMNRKRPVPRGSMTLHRHKSIRSARKG